jgi:membrane-associated phospholipid phosphatase
MKVYLKLMTKTGLFIIAFVSTILFHLSLSQAEEPDLSTVQTQKEDNDINKKPTDRVVKLDKEYFTGYWTDTKNILTSPARWETTDWIKASAIMGISIGLYTQDDKIKTWVQKNKNNTTSHLDDYASPTIRYVIPVLGGFGLYGYIAEDERAKRTFLLSTESLIITGVFVQTLKHSTGRHRPYTGDPHDTWSGPTMNGSYLSFPSGDASTAFAIASVVASEYDNIVVPTLVYTAASLIALERVYNNAHWSSDVFVGSAIGYFTGKAIVASHRNVCESNLSVVPLLDAKGVGLLVTYRY